MSSEATGRRALRDRRGWSYLRALGLVWVVATALSNLVLRTLLGLPLTARVPIWAALLLVSFLGYFDASRDDAGGAD